jgi:predicted nucleic acid-binding protein
VTLDFVEELANDPAIGVHWVGPQLHQQAIALLRRRPDKTYSLCDAVSFLLMREGGVTDALTTDRHFEQEGFVKLLLP